MIEAARAHLRRALALREEQDMEGARDAAADAARLAPDDPQIALAHAHLSYESWQPAAVLFERARMLAPGLPDILRGHAAALNAEGEGAAARALLTQTLAKQPGWIDGHKLLTTWRTTDGEGDGFDRSFADGCAAEPGNLSLRLAWFHVLATTRRWGDARRIIAEGEAHFGAQRAFDIARVFLASESDQASCDLALFDRVADVRDVGLDLCQVRFWLRNQVPAQAVAIAERHIAGPAARTFWPYLSLAWRLLDDAKAAWLDGNPLFVETCDLELSASELSTLSVRLRRLLTMQAPYPEQSVRGGVQTDRHLFFNPDPAIQNVRRRVGEAVAAYVARLPTLIPDHPLLAAPRDSIPFEGSWSVLLRGQGFHAPHTHNRGWISSALYVDLPDAPGPAPAGWLAFGIPPAELGLDLAPYRTVEPRPGRLVLFPATMWHCTMPFDDGERLSLAFDVGLH